MNGIQEVKQVEHVIICMARDGFIDLTLDDHAITADEAQHLLDTDPDEFGRVVCAMTDFGRSMAGVLF